MELEEASKAFLSRCGALNLADGTLAWYGHILRDLTAFLAAKGILRLGAVTPALLRDFLASLRQKGHASETIARTYGAIRCLFQFWTREGFLEKNPMELVERPRRERVLIRPMSPEQAARLLDQPDGRSVHGLRDRALMMLMLDSGLRVSEALSLEANRIDWMNCVLTVMGKGRKERSVPFSTRTCQALLEYARERGKSSAKSPQFFLGRTGKPLDRCKVRQRMKRCARQAGIEGVRVSPHTLRHTFAVMYVRNGGDAFSLQQILGHSTLEMTRRYVNFARQDVAAQHRKFSPMESLMGKPVEAISPMHFESVLEGAR
jgi:integrase/recombinase XerD